MQTLGLASEQKPTDGILKRLFWPTIENAYDVDLIGRQGFWLCFGLALVSMVALLIAGHPYIGLLLAITYYLAGVGVRERSLGAAIVVFVCYATDRIAGMLMMPVGSANPLFMIAALMLLVSNIRGTVLARRWSRATGPVSEAEFPDRASLPSVTALRTTGQKRFGPGDSWSSTRWLQPSCSSRLWASSGFPVSNPRGACHPSRGLSKSARSSPALRQPRRYPRERAESRTFRARSRRTDGADGRLWAEAVPCAAGV